MLSSPLLFLASCLVLISVSSASDVLVFTDNDFDSRIKEHDLVLAEFYAPWCGHCKKLAPEFDIASAALKVNDPPVALVKVDCTVETKVCAKFGVSGYPTLKIFKGGEVLSDYSGPREAQGIIKYMKTKAGPVIKELNTIQEIEKFLAAEQHAIVGFFTDKESALAKEFGKVADQLSENYRFGKAASADILAKYKHEDKVVIFQPPRLHTKLDVSEIAHAGEITVSAIKKFIKESIHGLVGHRTTSNAEDFGKPIVIVFFNVDYVKDIKGSNYVRNRVIKVAQKLKKEGLPISFAISNNDEFRSELTEFGFSAGKSDEKNIVGRDAKGLKYKFEGEYSVENLEKFARDLVAGTLEAYMKSEPVPESNPDAVVTVVAKNFEQVVNDETKDVLIEFYAPWCGHCKTLAPKYEELAQKIKDNTDIVIAKMDATANDVPPQYEVSGFPTIYWAPKGSKQAPRKYEGGREVDDFVKWLSKETKQTLGKKAKSDL